MFRGRIIVGGDDGVREGYCGEECTGGRDGERGGSGG